MESVPTPADNGGAPVTPKREQWTSRFGFIMATAGFAVGLGNIWRFPYQVGQNGGGAFLLVYLACAILIGVPLLTAEISLGRKSQRSPIAGMERLTGSRWHPWNLIGWLGVATAFIIGTYYMMLLAWILGYFVMISSGSMAVSAPDQIQGSFQSFVSTPLPVVGYDLILIVAIAFVVARGLEKGLERVAKIAMPVLFGMLMLLMVRSLTFAGATEGIIWYLKPDFSKLNGSVVLAALGQSFYSIGIGLAAAFGFGSYLDPEASDVPGSAALVVAFDTGVAVIIGFVIFPALFAFGLAPDSGPTLAFVTLPHLFSQMPAGQLFGAAFFLLLLIAGLTSILAVLEALAVTLCDSVGMTRRKAVITVASAWFLLSIPIILSQGPWSHITLFGRTLFGIADYVTGTYMIATAGLLTALYTAFAWGWRAFRDDTNVGSGRIKVHATWKPFVLFIIPVAVLLVLLAGQN